MVRIPLVMRAGTAGRGGTVDKSTASRARFASSTRRATNARAWTLVGANARNGSARATRATRATVPHGSTAGPSEDEQGDQTRERQRKKNNVTSGEAETGGGGNAKDPRKDRLAKLQQSYNARRTPPPLPPGFRVVVQEPTLKGSTKYRIVVQKTAGNETFANDDDHDDDDDESAGWVVVWRKGKEGSTLFLSSVEVKKDFRRRGIATRLLYEAEYFAAQLGCKEVELTVVKNNGAAIALYSRQGYVIDEGGGGGGGGGRGDGVELRGLAEGLFELVSDPQRILQYRMRKRLM